MLNLNWKSPSLEGFIYEMEYIETRGQRYLVKFKKYYNDIIIQECIVELTSDEIQIIKDHPDTTFEYIYNDKNGKNCYVVEFEYDASNKTIDEVRDDFDKEESFSNWPIMIDTLEKLLSFRFKPGIEYGMDYCCVNSNKVCNRVRVYSEPNKIDDWIDANKWSHVRSAIKWSAENLQVFQEAKKEGKI